MCSFANSSIPGYETGKAIVGDVVDFATSWTNWGLENVGGRYYNDIKNTVKYYWQVETRNDYRERLLQSTSQFFELASPDMLRLINDGLQKESVDSFAALEDMLNHAKWIDAFSVPDIFDNTKKPMEAFTMKSGPLGLVLSLPAAERKKMYAAYVDRFIPRQVQEEHVDIFGPDVAGPAHEDAVEASSAMLNDSMRDMLGILDGVPVDGKSREIAAQTLSRRYADTVGKRVTIRDGIPVEETLRGFLHSDFDKLTGGVPTFRDIRDVQDMSGPSLLKGAAKLGVITDADIAEYANLARERSRERDVQLGETSRQRETLTQVTKKQLSREAMSMSDVWHNMGGFEKLGLIVAGFFALQSKGIRNVAIAGAGYYYLSKFFLKSEKPFAPLEKGTQGITSMFFNMPGVKEAREAVGLTTPLTAQESIARGQVVSDFLSKEAKEDIDRSVMGFELLHDMPLNEIAQYVEFGSFTAANEKAVLRTWDPTFQKKGRAVLEARGVSKQAIDRFFSDTSVGTLDVLNAADVRRLSVGTINANALQTGDALATVFYLVGARNRALAADVQFVDQARDAAGGSYDALPSTFTDRTGRTDDPRKIFADIARAGRDGADSQTLGQFMAERMGLRNPPKSQAEALEDSKFSRKRRELEMYAHPKYEVRLSAADRGNVVEVGEPSMMGMQNVLILPKTEFLKKSVEELVDIWILKQQNAGRYFPPRGATPGPGSTASSAPGSTTGSAPGSTPAAAPGSTTASAPGATPSSSPGSTTAAAPGSTPSSAPGSTPTTAPGSTPASAPGATPSPAPGPTTAVAPGSTPSAAPSASPSSATPGPTSTPASGPTSTPVPSSTPAPRGSGPSVAPAAGPTVMPTPPSSTPALPGSGPSSAPRSGPTSAPSAPSSTAPRGSGPSAAPASGPTGAPNAPGSTV